MNPSSFFNSLFSSVPSNQILPPQRQIVGPVSGADVALVIEHGATEAEASIRVVGKTDRIAAASTLKFVTEHMPEGTRVPGAVGADMKIKLAGLDAAARDRLRELVEVSNCAASLGNVEGRDRLARSSAACKCLAAGVKIVDAGLAPLGSAPQWECPGPMNESQARMLVTFAETADDIFSEGRDTPVLAGPLLLAAALEKPQSAEACTILMDAIRSMWSHNANCHQQPALERLAAGIAAFMSDVDIKPEIKLAFQAFCDDVMNELGSELCRKQTPEGLEVLKRHVKAQAAALGQGQQCSASLRGHLAHYRDACAGAMKTGEAQWAAAVLAQDVPVEFELRPSLISDDVTVCIHGPGAQAEHSRTYQFLVSQGMADSIHSVDLQGATPKIHLRGDAQMERRLLGLMEASTCALQLGDVAHREHLAQFPGALRCLAGGTRIIDVGDGSPGSAPRWECQARLSIEEAKDLGELAVAINSVSAAPGALPSKAGLLLLTAAIEKQQSPDVAALLMRDAADVWSRDAQLCRSPVLESFADALAAFMFHPDVPRKDKLEYADLQARLEAELLRKPTSERMHSLQSLLGARVALLGPHEECSYLLAQSLRQYVDACRGAGKQGHAGWAVMELKRLSANSTHAATAYDQCDDITLAGMATARTSQEIFEDLTNAGFRFDESTAIGEFKIARFEPEAQAKFLLEYVTLAPDSSIGISMMASALGAKYRHAMDPAIASKFLKLFARTVIKDADTPRPELGRYQRVLAKHLRREIAGGWQDSADDLLELCGKVAETSPREALGLLRDSGRADMSDIPHELRARFMTVLLDWTMRGNNEGDLCAVIENALGQFRDLADQAVERRDADSRRILESTGHTPSAWELARLDRRPGGLPEVVRLWAAMRRACAKIELTTFDEAVRRRYGQNPITELLPSKQVQAMMEADSVARQTSSGAVFFEQLMDLDVRELCPSALDRRFEFNRKALAAGDFPGATAELKKFVICNVCLRQAKFTMSSCVRFGAAARMEKMMEWLIAETGPAKPRLIEIFATTFAYVAFYAGGLPIKPRDDPQWIALHDKMTKYMIRSVPVGIIRTVDQAIHLFGVMAAMKHRGKTGETTVEEYYDQLSKFPAAALEQYFDLHLQAVQADGPHREGILLNLNWFSDEPAASMTDPGVKNYLARYFMLAALRNSLVRATFADDQLKPEKIMNLHLQLAEYLESQLETWETELVLEGVEVASLNI